MSAAAAAAESVAVLAGQCRCDGGPSSLPPRAAPPSCLAPPSAPRSSKIVDGRVEKIAKNMALLEQAFVKDTNKTVAGEERRWGGPTRAAAWFERTRRSPNEARPAHARAAARPPAPPAAEVVKEAVASIGENIQIRRFQR